MIEISTGVWIDPFEIESMCRVPDPAWKMRYSGWAYGVVAGTTPGPPPKEEPGSRKLELTMKTGNRHIVESVLVDEAFILRSRGLDH